MSVNTSPPEWKPQTSFCGHSLSGGNIAPQALDGRGRRAGAGLAVEPVRAAALVVRHPVRRRHPLVGAAHLHPALAGHRRRLGRGRGDDRVGPPQLLLDLQVHPLDVGRRGEVAAVQPGPAGWGGRAAGRSGRAASARPRPGPRASTCPSSPSGRSSTSRPSPGCPGGRRVEEVFGLQLAFQADGVQAHVAARSAAGPRSGAGRRSAACPRTSRRRESGSSCR